MQNKTLILIPVLAVALAVSGCGKKEAPRGAVNNNNAQRVSQNTNTNSSANTNTNINTNANIPDEPKTNQKDIKDILCSTIDYNGQVIKKEDGWKRYINENLGIEFRFKDEEDRMDVNGSRNGINIEVKRAIRNQYEVEPYIDLSIHDSSIKGYSNLKEFIKEQGAGIDFNEIISMEEIKNDNNLSFLEVLFKITRTPSMPPFYKEGEPERFFEIIIYYTEHNRPLKCQDDCRCCDTKVNKEQNYVSMRGTDDLIKQVVNSLKFID